ncbi:MAG: AarF/UbiB family protein [Anaerolineae bacterium]
MRQFAFQTVANTLALIITIALLPGINLVDALPLIRFLGWESYAQESTGLVRLIFIVVVLLMLGILYTLIVRYIRPLLLGITGSFIVWSFGVSIIIVNIITFWLFVTLAPVTWQITNPAWVRIIVGGIFLSIFETAISVLTGVNQPRIMKGDPDEGYWQFVERLPVIRGSGLVESIRVSQIYNKLFIFGTDVAMTGRPPGRWRAAVYELMYQEPDPRLTLTLPEKTRILLESLGPTWVKFGQMVASQSDSLPPEWADELTRLQSSAQPFPSDQVVRIITSELGKPPDQVYASFELEPMAAASTAQVHKATLADGTLVAVKVQRPDIIAKTKADLAIIQNVARALQGRSKTAAQIDLIGITRQFAIGVMDELDYRNESYHTRRLADNMKTMPGIHVPAIYLDLSSARVLTEEFIVGIKLTKTQAIEAAGLDRDVLANNFLAAIIKQILVDGFFHADPHPGNLFVDTNTGVITFLDLGLIGELSQQQRFNLMDLLFTMTQNDPTQLAQVAANMSRRTRPFNETAYRADMTDVFYKYWIYSRSGVSFNEFMQAITGTLNKYGMRLDSSLTLAVKAIVQADQSLHALNPQLDLVTAAVAQARDLLTSELTPERVVQEVRSQVIRLGRQVVRELPSLEDATLSWITQYKRGKFVVTVDTSDLTKGVDRFSLAVNRLTLGIILVGMLIGSAIALTSLRAWFEPTESVFYPLLLAGVFGIVLVFAGYVAIKMAGSLREPKDPYEE